MKVRSIIREIRRDISAGTLTAAGYAEQCLETVRAKDGEIHAFVEVDPASVMEQVRSAEPNGPLAWIPVAVKDNLCTIGLRTRCGSRILGDFRSPADATAVQRLRNSGAVIFGKTNLDEFAMGSSTEHSAFGPTRNPLDLGRVPGGSSGGSAAAVAAGMVPVALGSDTGGSVRQPAAFCGIVGLKPTYGRVSRSGLVAFASSLDQVGICSRTVEDAAIVLESIAGKDQADSTSSSVAIDHYSQELWQGIEGARCGVIAEAVDMLDAQTRANFDHAIGVLRKGGAVIEQISIPSLKSAIAVYYIIANAEASANLSRFDGIRFGVRVEADSVRSTYVESRTAGFGPEVKRRIMLGTFALSSGYYDAYYGRAQKVRQMMSAEFARAFERVEFLLTPTTPSSAFRIGEKAADPLSMYLSDIFTVPANLVGIPAIAVPSGVDERGLPLSLQIMTSHFAEARLLQCAAFFEAQSEYDPGLEP